MSWRPREGGRHGLGTYSSEASIARITRPNRRSRRLARLVPARVAAPHTAFPGHLTGTPRVASVTSVAGSPGLGLLP